MSTVVICTRVENSNFVTQMINRVYGIARLMRVKVRYFTIFEEGQIVGNEGAVLVLLQNGSSPLEQFTWNNQEVYYIYTSTTLTLG